MRIFAFVLCSFAAYYAVGRIGVEKNDPIKPVVIPSDSEIIELPMEGSENFVIDAIMCKKTGKKYITVQNSFSAQFYDEKGVYSGKTWSSSKNNIAFFPVETGMATTRIESLKDGIYLFREWPTDTPGTGYSVRYPMGQQTNPNNIFSNVVQTIFFGDENVLALGYENGDIKIFAMLEQKKIGPIVTKNIGTVNAMVTTLVDLGDGYLGAGSIEGDVRVWNVTTGECVSDFFLHSPVVSIFKMNKPIDNNHVGLVMTHHPVLMQPPFNKVQLAAYSFSTATTNTKDVLFWKGVQQICRLNDHSLVYNQTENEPAFIKQNFARRTYTDIQNQASDKLLCAWDNTIIFWEPDISKKVYRLRILKDEDQKIQELAAR